MKKKLAWLIYLLGMVMLLSSMWGNHHGMKNHRVHGWNWYHYWVGSKYHEEVGYFDMYSQTIAAWREMKADTAKVSSSRNLRTYKMKRVWEGKVPWVRNQLWTDARWAEFKSDLRKLRKKQSYKKWNDCVKDRGYNASPAWNTPASWLTNALDVGKSSHIRFAKSIDMGLILGLALLLPLAFGPTRSITAVFISLLVANNTTRFHGSFVQYDWIVLVLGSAALISKKKHGWGGFLLGVATAVRIFPLVFFAAMVARAVLDLLLTRRLPPWLPRLAGGFGLALILGFGVGAAGPRGLDGWSEWREKIQVHTHFHKTGDGRVGLNHIFTSKQGPRGQDIPKISERFKTLEETKPIRLAVAGLLLALLAAACWNRDELDCFILAIVAFFALTVSSRYYWSALALLPFLGFRTRDKASLGIGLSISLFLTASYYLFCEDLGHTYVRWRAQNFFMLGTFTLGLITLAALGFRKPLYVPGEEPRPEPGSLPESAPQTESTPPASGESDSP
ncbi:MAG: DUF2029 domain-containing protein [Deltaproteobacteria bacterium]|nr:DUF2029 domain-containing protein [Deltaproteobacteria bacterium]